MVGNDWSGSERNGFGEVPLVEKLIRGKRRERENAAILRKAGCAGTHPEVLAAWEHSLSETEAAARRWLESRLQDSQKKLAKDSRTALEALIRHGAEQSHRWVQFLREVAGTSAADAENSIPASSLAEQSEAFLIGFISSSTKRGLIPEGFWTEHLGGTVEPVPVAEPEPEPEDAAPVPIGGHTLPPLPYGYGDLEPYLDAETVRIHHAILHNNYVKGLNTAEEKLAAARSASNFELVKHWERELAFNGSGHYLHTVYFYGMSPDGGGSPGGDLSGQIAADFGSFESFKEHFSQAAEKVEGSGWAILVWSPRSLRLQILQAEKHQNLTQWDDVPLLAIDVWEHSYYLSYKNERAKYIDAWFQIVNWPYAERRFQKARRLKWRPF